ncbi:MAG: hypothetical protein K2P50_04340 [Lachnospiraceae bacterium]|nr:hypothetical protein [Lachnospiraceae bacterium]
MISSIVGRYLLKRELLTAGQLETALVEQRKVRAKLGLIAVAEGLMTQDETEKVHKLQAVTDKRFGDIAVEKEYLTREDVEMLLNKQENAYLAFAQVLENHSLMTMEELEQCMSELAEDYNLTLLDIEDLKSDDIDRILPLFMPVGCDKYLNIAGSALRMLTRRIDTEIFVEKAFITDRHIADNGAVQTVEGEPGFSSGILGKGNSLLSAVSAFDSKEYTEINEESMNAAGELLNCLNSFYARNLNKGGAYIKLRSPEYSAEIDGAAGEEMMVMPVYIQGERMDLIISSGCEIKMEMSK